MLLLHEGDRWLAVHIRKLTVGRGVSSLPDGAVHRSSGQSASAFKNNHFRNVPLSLLLFTQVGPHAINLAGAQAAAMRIAKDILYRQQQDGTEVSEPSREKTKTEEYIQQMRGLLWL